MDDDSADFRLYLLTAAALVALIFLGKWLGVVR